MVDLGQYRIQLKPTIGKGTFGETYRGTNTENGQEIAAKKVIVQEELWESDKLPHVLSAMALLKDMDKHPNLAKVLDSMEKMEENALWIIREYATLSNLHDYMKIYDMTVSHKLSTISQVISGLYFLHSLQPQGLVHGCISPENITITFLGNQHVVKLCDYGVASILHSACNRPLFTTPYRAPEFYAKDADTGYFNPAADIFEAGIMFYQLVLARGDLNVHEVTKAFIGKVMFETQNEFDMKIEPFDYVIEANIKTLLATMIKKAKGERPSSKEVLHEVERLKATLPGPIGIPSLRSPQALNGDHGGGQSHRQQASNRRTPSANVSLPVLRKVFSQVLTDEISAYIGFSNEGLIMENNKDDKKLVNLHLPKEEAQAYVRQWVKSRPEDVEQYDRKYILDDGRMAMRANDTNPTLIFTKDLNIIDKFTGNFGYLRGVISPDLLLYCKKKEGTWKLAIYKASDHSKVLTLTQPVTSFNISVCRHTSSGWIAVVDKDGKTLDIFMSDLSHHQRIQLPFQPDSMNAIASVKDYIIISKYLAKELFVYTWNGAMLSRTMVDASDIIWGIGPGREGIMQVCAGLNHLDVYSIE